MFNLISHGDMDIYVHKMNTNGDFLWAKQIGGTDIDYPYSIVLDKDESIYTAGSFRSDTVDFDPGVGLHNIVNVGNMTDSFRNLSSVFQIRELMSLQLAIR